MDIEELNAKLIVLKEYIEKGKIKFKRGSGVVDSLLKVRYESNGKVDPSTVDESVRALANAISMMKYKEELKQIPLKEVQSGYFEILETYFGHPFQEMKKHNVTPHQIAVSMVSKESVVRAFALDAENFEKGILEFWEASSPVVEAHIEYLQGLKAVYGGDIFPSYRNNILSNTGLYVDTTILPDPMLRVASFFRFMKINKALYYLIKHALSALSLKEMVLADVEPPLAIFAADYFPLDENVRAFIQFVGEKDLITHLEKAFELEFGNQEQLDHFLKAIDDLTSLKTKLKHTDYILFDTEWENLSFEEQWEKVQKENDFFDYDLLATASTGEKVKFLMSGRMMQINEIVFKSFRFHGVPLIDAPTSWQYFLWKYKYDQERSKEVNPELRNIFIVNALQNEKLLWLGNIPSNELIKLREEGALYDLRELISRGIKNIEDADERSFEEVVNEVVSNINEALSKHAVNLKRHSVEMKKFFGFDIAPWVITAGLSIATATTGNIPLSIISASAGLISCLSARDLWKKGKAILKQKNSIQRSPVGILFNIQNTPK